LSTWSPLLPAIQITTHLISDQRSAAEYTIPQLVGADPMQPAQPLAPLVTLLSFCGGIFVLALSPERWQTFKKMVLAFVAIIFLLVIVGLTVASPLPPIRVVVADLTGTLVLQMAFCGQP